MHKSKIESVSPTVYSNIFILSTIIDTFEGRDVATADIKGAFLNTTMSKFIVVKLINKQVDIISKIDSMHDKYITYEKGRKVIYLMLNSELYRTLQGVLLLYKFLVSKLQSIRFVLNSCDLCVANADINRK